MLPISPTTRNRLLAIVILAGCAVCVAARRPWHRHVRGAAQATLSPPLGLFAASHTGIRNTLDRISALWHASSEVERLRDENRSLREALAREADHARQARVRLRNIQAFQTARSEAQARPLSVLAANVLAADASSWRHSLIIDRGEADGVRVGAAAVWGSSIVGTIVAVRTHAATVRLLNDSRAGITVRVARTGDVGLLRGTADREGLLALKWIHLQPIEVGDTVITAGRDAIVPPGLVAGRITKASRTREPLFYHARVRPLLDLDRLTEVLVVSYRPGEAEELLDGERTAPQ